MKSTRWITLAIACALAAHAAEQPEAELETAARPSRWRFSAGARFAPGVKTTAGISSRAIIDAAGRLRGSTRATSEFLPSDPAQTSTERSSTTSADQTSDTVAMPLNGRIVFPDGSFIDMNDDAGVPGETCNWHFNSAAAFSEANGTIDVASSASTETTTESSTSRSEDPALSATSFSSSFSERVMPDATSSHEADLWGGDVEVGYDFFVGERFSLGLVFGTSFYRNENAIRAAGRCYEASSSTARETRTGRYATTTETTATTTVDTQETTTFTDPNFAYDGALDDILNDDGSLGAGTPDGYTNPYGGYNPVLTVSDGSITHTTSTETRKDTTVETTRVFEETGGDTSRTSSRRTIDVFAEGEVETREMRLALQPAWKAAKWLELRGSIGAAATRVRVETDATILVNGSRFSAVSGDDSDWVFTGVCGLDAVLRPVEWLEVFAGADLRLGDNRMDYSAGLAQGKVELARATYRAGVGIRF